MVIPREPRQRRGLRRDYTQAPLISKAYLIGLLHDATARKTTFRIATKSKDFAEVIQRGIANLGRKAWIYKEGKLRNLWIVEFSKSILKDTKLESKQEKLDYIRGFFDAEGGIAKNPKVRYYLYFCQKNRNKLLQLKQYLSEFGIQSGKVHNPSKRVDPNYWRFFIRIQSYERFAQVIGSSHPEKRRYLRMKI
jgi:intein/homing endonuclease